VPPCVVVETTWLPFPTIRVTYPVGAIPSQVTKYCTIPAPQDLLLHGRICMWVIWEIGSHHREGKKKGLKQEK